MSCLSRTQFPFKQTFSYKWVNVDQLLLKKASYLRDVGSSQTRFTNTFIFSRREEITPRMWTFIKIRGNPSEIKCAGWKCMYSAPPHPFLPSLCLSFDEGKGNQAFSCVNSIMYSTSPAKARQPFR